MEQWTSKYGGVGGGKGRGRGLRPSGPPASLPAAPAPARAAATGTEIAPEGFFAKIWSSIKKLGSTNLLLLFGAVALATGGVIYVWWYNRKNKKAEPALEEKPKQRRRRPREPEVAPSVGPSPPSHAVDGYVHAPPIEDDGPPLPPLES